MESVNPLPLSETHSQKPPNIYSELTLKIKNAFKDKTNSRFSPFDTIKALPSKTLTNEPFEVLDKVNEHELRAKRKNDFEEEMFKDTFPTDEELAYHKRLLEGPHLPFSTLDLKIRRGHPWSLKIPYVIGTVYMGHAYIDLQSPINIMSRTNYNKIRTKPLQARRNPYQPHKICNFIGRARSLHVFVGCFNYVVDFMILEDIGCVIDGRLSEVVLRKPFFETSKLEYDQSLGLIRFAHKNDEVIFRMP
ncbi:hypothetical protein Tco_0707820 [Tanacetum coccineum]